MTYELIIFIKYKIKNLYLCEQFIVQNSNTNVEMLRGRLILARVVSVLLT